MTTIEMVVRVDPETGDTTAEVRVNALGVGVASGTDAWRDVAAVARGLFGEDCDRALTAAEDVVAATLLARQQASEDTVRRRRAAVRAWQTVPDARAGT